MDTKVIRFYANIQPKPQPMDILTIDDLKAAGFVHYRFRGATKDPITMMRTVVENTKFLVHSSAPIGNSISECTMADYGHPFIQHELGVGWEAKWGAIRFQLSSEVQLWRFLKQFGYPLPIDQQPDEK